MALVPAPRRRARFGLVFLAALAGSACQQAPQQPTTALPVVDRTTGAPVEPGKEPPDAAATALARAGVDVGQRLGTGLGTFAPLTAAIRAAREKHPAAPSYRLAQVAGWRFLGGWWVRDGDGDRLRAAVEDAAGTLPGWDVTDEANYGPDMQPAFPAGLVRMRLDLDLALPAGGRLAVTFIAPLGRPGQAAEAIGVGSLVVPGELGAVAVEALNARLAPDGEVERGEIVLRNQATPMTLVFAGRFTRAGLQSPATVMRSARPLGEVVEADGRWRITNQSGNYPL